MLRLLDLLRHIALAHASLGDTLRSHLWGHANSRVAIQASHFLGQEDQVDVFKAEFGGLRVVEIDDWDEEGLYGN